MVSNEYKNKYMNKQIRIDYIDGEPRYSGRTGTVTHVDDMGQLHGTWGGLAVIPGTDDFSVIG